MPLCLNYKEKYAHFQHGSVDVDAETRQFIRALYFFYKYVYAFCVTDLKIDTGYYMLSTSALCPGPGRMTAKSAYGR